MNVAIYFNNHAIPWGAKIRDVGTDAMLSSEFVTCEPLGS